MMKRHLHRIVFAFPGNFGIDSKTLRVCLNTLRYNNHGEIVAKTRNICHQWGKDINHENRNLSIKKG